MLDTSVLIASCVQLHPNHSLASQQLKQSRQDGNQLVLAGHSLAETYSVMVRAPFKPKIIPEMAGKLINQNLLPNAELTSLRPGDYIDLVQKLAIASLGGGLTYDAILLFTAKLAHVDRFVTSNTKDFVRLRHVVEFEGEIVGV